MVTLDQKWFFRCFAEFLQSQLKNSVSREDSGAAMSCLLESADPNQGILPTGSVRITWKSSDGHDGSSARREI